MISGAVTSVKMGWPAKRLIEASTARRERSLSRVPKHQSDTNLREYSYRFPREVRIESATAERELPGELDQRVESLFKDARDEFFEEGMASAFSRGLVDLVVHYGDMAIVAMAPYVTQGRINAEVATETLRWLSQVENVGSYLSRRWLIERCLQSDIVRVRDSAALSLASLDDPHSIPYLKQALHVEPCEEFRENLQAILSYLERHR